MIQKPLQSHELDIAKTFGNATGKRVLEHLLERGSKHFRIDQRPTSAYPNEAFLNPNAALYRAGIEDTVRYIERIIKKVKNFNEDIGTSTEIIEAMKRGDETL